MVRRMSAEPADAMEPPRLRCKVLLRANPGPAPPSGLGLDGVVDPLRGIRAGEARPASEVIPPSMGPKIGALAQQSDDAAGHMLLPFNKIVSVSRKALLEAVHCDGEAAEHSIPRTCRLNR